MCGGGGVWWSVVEGGCVMTSLINIRHNVVECGGGRVRNDVTHYQRHNYIQ